MTQATGGLLQQHTSPAAQVRVATSEAQPPNRMMVLSHHQVPMQSRVQSLVNNSKLESRSSSLPGYSTAMQCTKLSLLGLQQAQAGLHRHSEQTKVFNSYNNKTGRRCNSTAAAAGNKQSWIQPRKQVPEHHTTQNCLQGQPKASQGTHRHTAAPQKGQPTVCWHCKHKIRCSTQYGLHGGRHHAKP
jgi:hypothetical protein